MGNGREEEVGGDVIGSMVVRRQRQAVGSDRRSVATCTDRRGDSRLGLEKERGGNRERKKGK